KPIIIGSHAYGD
nr:Chain C, LYS-PRO-ILE-ILE-ILE-GLY-SER-HIS-ALA-TYR-GLY-ASP [Homo sapiens]5GIR_D Chain D, LYS-PRO-ILE-ILE-ILE-GLY-SER-HIS-ALA-TYR-GLY-ASP [Homo sapiens]